MPYSIELGPELGEIPRAVQTCLRDALDEITSVIAAVPPGSTFLTLFRGEKLQLDLMGWRFQYVVEPDRGTVKVVGARLSE